MNTKPRARKLSLALETLRHLSDSERVRASGGTVLMPALDGASDKCTGPAHTMNGCKK